MSDVEESGENNKPVIVRNLTDLQRLKLEKLMKNPVSGIVQIIVLKFAFD